MKNKLIGIGIGVGSAVSVVASLYFAIEKNAYAATAAIGVLALCTIMAILRVKE